MVKKPWDFCFLTFSPPILKITPRDRSILRSIAKLTLTTRLIWEHSQIYDKPFTSYDSLYRRLRKLCQAGFLCRDRLLSNGEWYYYLSKAGQSWLVETEGMVVSTRATRPVKGPFQQHEYEISRFWIRWFADCKKLNIPILAFWRDGEFIATVNDQKDRKLYKLIPDGTVVIQIRGKARVLFLEMDNGTQTSGVDRTSKGVFRRKLKHYRQFFPSCPRHPFLSAYKVHRIRVMTVCRSQARVSFLKIIAEEERVGSRAAFTSWSHIVEITNLSAQGWKYRPSNILAVPVFFYSGRSPPRSILT